jgi:hypothetical protein
MSSGKGGSGASPSYNYFGTLAGVVCLGPVDKLHAVLVDGKAIYEPSGGLAASGNYSDLTSSIEAKYFTAGGYVRIYWGTDAQTADPALSGHPPYRGICYVVLSGFLFGREKTNAPNIEVIVSRAPRPPTELVHPDHTALVDGQANPVAVAAELLTSPLCAGWAVANMDATTWLAVSAAIHGSTEAQLTAFGSPLITKREELRRVLRDLLNAADLWVRDVAGVLEIGQSTRGGSVTGLPLLTAADFTEAPQVDTAGWSDVPERVLVKFRDRTRWKESTEIRDNPVARLVQSVGKTTTLDLPWVTRREQAGRQAHAWLRRFGAPGLTAKVNVRRGKAVGLLPGDRVRLDLDPEPSDEIGLAVTGLIVDREEGEESVTLVVESDRQSAAVPYVAALEDTEPQATEVDPIEHALAIPLPPSGWGLPAAVAVLAARPSAEVVGMVVSLGPTAEDPVVELGDQVGFAARVTLADDLSIFGDEIELDLVDLTTGPDAYLRTLAQADDPIEARADRLILVLAEVTDGAVTVDGDGRPVLEFLSLYNRTASEDHDDTFNALRSRYGLPARAWTAATAKGWLLPAVNLKPWRHPDFDGLLLGGGSGVLLLQSFSAFVADESTPVPEIPVSFPPSYARAPRIDWTTPSGTGATDTAGDIAIEFDVVDREGDLIGIRVDSARPDGSGYTQHLDVGFAATGARNVTATITLPTNAGTETLGYVLRVEARDRSGNVTISTRSILRPPNSGSATNLEPPTFSPNGSVFVTDQSVVVTAASPATGLDYVIGDPGSAQPSSGTAEGDTSATLYLSFSARIWARSTGSIDPSAWVFADFTRLPGGGGGGGQYDV